MHRVNIKGLTKIRLAIVPGILIVSGGLLLAWIFTTFYTASIHADYETTIIVPNYKSINESSHKVTPRLLLGLGPKLNSKEFAGTHSNELMATVNVQYKNSGLNIKKTSLGKNQNYQKNREKAVDRYIKAYPKAKQEYLLKVRPKKVAWLKAFFSRYNSPLKANVYDFVYASEYYGIDYRLLPAISIVESGGGKHLFRPYNPFGWGRHGYKSFKEAIWDVARGLSVYHYRLKRTTPESIGRLYNPVTPTHWARKVRYLMSLMPKY